MRIRRSLAKLSTTTGDPNNLQTPRRCSNAITCGSKNSIITCVFNHSPWDLAEPALPKFVGGLFSLTGTSQLPDVLKVPLCGSSSFKLSGEGTKQLLGVSEGKEHCRRLNTPPHVKIRAEKSDSGRTVVVSGKKPQIRAGSVNKPLEASDSAIPKRRVRTVKRSAVDPNEFYYYSGFSPHWGKKRENVSKSTPVANKSTHVSPDQELLKEGNGKTGNEFLDYDDDDDDVDEYELVGTTRPNGRKRVKARSLKSLM